MQLVPRYLVKNQITVIADLTTGTFTEYKPVYQRTVQIYRGINNLLEFRLLNADQKPINTQGYTPVIMVYDSDKNLIVERVCDVLDDGSSATRGLFTVNITENDLLNIRQQYLSYNIYLLDQNNQKVITYTDSHFGNDGVMYVQSTAFPGPKPTKSLEIFHAQGTDPEQYVTDVVDAEPGINNNSALHTCAIYSQGFVGDVIVQATLDNQITQDTVWDNVTTITLTGTETQPIPQNFQGMFQYIRFATDTDPAETISKILIRN